jgi:hypothetical protein
MDTLCDQGEPPRPGYEQLNLQFAAKFQRELRTQAKRFKRTRHEQLNYWITVGMVFDSMIHCREPVGTEEVFGLNEPLKSSHPPLMYGTATLLLKEGGCTDVSEAVILYRGKRKSASRSKIIKMIQTDALVSYPVIAGYYWIPRWQFKEEGGALDGLVPSIQILTQRPGFSAITPFVFFLQPAPRLADTPLNLLRMGRVRAVEEAAREYSDRAV